MKYFKREEFDCTQTGENKIQPLFLDAIDELREVCGFPFHVVSGYRSPKHTIEAAKPGGPGMHSKGLAADIRVGNGIERGLIIKNAIEMGFKGIGVAKTYIHVDLRGGDLVIWTY